MSKHNVNPMADLMTDCPPDNPHQLYINAGLIAMGEEYGTVMNELSEEVTNILINAAATAISAALEAAMVPDNWLGLVKRTVDTSLAVEVMS